MKKSLLLLLAALATLVASAQTKVEIDGIWYNLTSETQQAEVTYKGSSHDEYSYEYSGSINLPATVTYEGVDYRVTSIGNSTVRNCTSLTAITIPASVTSIGKSAFYWCSSLTAITIPENSQLTSIGYEAFSSCYSLTAITIPASVTSIGGYAFYYCDNLTTVTIPENSQLTWIGDRAFSYCSSLTAITIPEGVTSIGGYAFEDCSRFTSITIPKGVTSIGDGAFSGCSSLTAVHISDIAAWCNIEFFDNYSNPLCCAHNLYLNGELVTQLTLPEDVTSIGNYAFYSCYSLTAIDIPEGVTSIGYYAFSRCSSLTAITLPEGVTSIGTYAFEDCSSLTAITCKAVAPPTLENSEVFNGVNKSIPVYVPAGSIEDYKAAAYWNEFTNYADIEAGINELTGDNSQLTIYDLSGRRVEKAEKGIYIVNEVKVVIK